MTFTELLNTLESRRKGLGYQIWRQATLTRQIFSKTFPKSAERAVPELFPKKGIPMPDFLLNDLIKKGG